VSFSKIALILIGLSAVGLVIAQVLFKNTDEKMLVIESANDPATTPQQTTPEDSPSEAKPSNLGIPLTPEQRNAVVKTKDISMGSSKMASQGKKVSFNIVVKLMDGKVVFDSRGDSRPWTGTIGDGSLMNGIDRGIRGMYQGGKRAIWIPSLFAYGPNGISGQVPPNSDLYAEVELLTVF
jgi:FKBP-type peptidyl-prolyl cis-trans isomerase